MAVSGSLSTRSGEETCLGLDTGTWLREFDRAIQSFSYHKMAIALAKTLTQANTALITALGPKMKVIADDVFKRISELPLDEWSRQYEQPLSSGWSSSKETLTLGMSIEITEKVSAAIREVVTKEDVDPSIFFHDAIGAMRTHLDVLFYKSGFTYYFYTARRSPMKGSDVPDDDDNDNTGKVILNISLVV